MEHSTSCGNQSLPRNRSPLQALGNCYPMADVLDIYINSEPVGIISFVIVLKVLLTGVSLYVPIPIVLKPNTYSGLDKVCKIRVFLIFNKTNNMCKTQVETKLTIHIFCSTAFSVSIISY